jgi:hypothetical protein
VAAREWQTSTLMSTDSTLASKGDRERVVARLAEAHCAALLAVETVAILVFVVF